MSAAPTRRGLLDGRDLVALAEHLARRGTEAIESLDGERLETAFAGAIEAFRDPHSPERRRLDPDLARAAGLSQPCLDASLDALLDGFSATEIAAVLGRGRALRAGSPSRPPNDREDRHRSPRLPHLLVLAAHPPGLVLQPLLAGLAAAAAVLVKSSTREPFFAPAFAAALAAREPALGEAIAAVVWRGGEAAIESNLQAVVDRVVGYGDRRTIDALRRHAGDKLVAFGPKASVAIVDGDLSRTELESVARELARDVALFEQRGCLSLQAIYAGAAIAEPLADALAAALADTARRWPPPALEPAEAATVRLAREETAFLGGRVAAIPIDCGTVLVDRRAVFVPSPGHRTVRVHAIPAATAAIDILRPFAGRLQGAALAGSGAAAAAAGLRRLGVSHLCAPGKLQSPGASWANGGIDLVAALSGAPACPASSPGSPSRPR